MKKKVPVVNVVVGEDTAIAAILKDVETCLAPSEIDPDNQPAAARQILAATLELLYSHELDACFLPNDLKGSIEIDPAARIVSQAGCQQKRRRATRRSTTQQRPFSTGFIGISGKLGETDDHATLRRRLLRSRPDVPPYTPAHAYHLPRQRS